MSDYAKLSHLPDTPPSNYDRAPEYDRYLSELDVYVPMRDGVKICIDVYRPDAEGKFPALLAFAVYNKDVQGPRLSGTLPPQPSWAPLWCGPLEAGDTRYLTSRGYVHVIGSPRATGKSEGGGSRDWDCYDLIDPYDKEEMWNTLCRVMERSALSNISGNRPASSRDGWTW